MKKYRYEIAMVCHEMMKAGQSVGAVIEKEMKEFEKNRLVKDPEERSAKQRRHVTTRWFAPNGGV